MKIHYILLISLLILSPSLQKREKAIPETQNIFQNNEYPVAEWGSPSDLEILEDIFKGLGMGFFVGIQEGRNWLNCTTGVKNLIEDYKSTFELFREFSFMNMLRGLGAFYVDIENSVILVRTCANGALGFIDFVDVFRKSSWKEFLIHTGENILANAIYIFAEVTALIQAARFKEYYDISINVGQILYQIFFSHAYQREYPYSS